MSKPPRRYSVGQPDFDMAIAERLIVKLDGITLDKVIEYDADKGSVLVFRVDGQGSIVVKDNDAVRDSLDGYVTVEWRSDVQA